MLKREVLDATSIGLDWHLQRDKKEKKELILLAGSDSKVPADAGLENPNVLSRGKDEGQESPNALVGFFFNFKTHQ